MIVKAFLGVSFALAITSSVSAETPDPFHRITLDCNFTKYVLTTTETTRVETINKEGNLAITFSGFDAGKGEALHIGNVGVDKVLYTRGDRRIMLIQSTPKGNGTMTTISDPKDGVSIAFHTRHVWIGNEPVVSHYHTGTCKKR